MIIIMKKKNKKKIRSTKEQKPFASRMFLRNVTMCVPVRRTKNALFQTELFTNRLSTGKLHARTCEDSDNEET
jgi:hypothetical protein